MDADLQESRRETVARKQRREVGERLLALVKEALDKGLDPPWRKPWVGGLGSHRSGRKGGSGPYQGLNAWVLWEAASRHRYVSIRWYTQAEGARQGWTVRAGAEAQSIITPMPGRSGLGSTLSAGDWGTTTVYNRDSFDGPEPEPPPKPWDGVRGIGRVIALARTVGLDLVPDADRAYFAPLLDRVGMPPRSHFTAENWSATLLHELVHWTGHESRLRRIKHPWTEEEYALEELVAELGAAMLCAAMELPGTRVDDPVGSGENLQHREYLAIWAGRIRKDPEALPNAFTAAERAVDFLQALAPDAFKLQRGDAGLAGIADAPVTLSDGDAWRGDARTRILAAKEPPSGDGPGPAAPMLDWLVAFEKHPDKGPILLFTGAPGDGADAMFENVRRLMTGTGTVSVPQAFDGEEVPRAGPNVAQLPAVAFRLRGKGTIPALPSLPATAADALDGLEKAVGSAPVALVARYVSLPGGVTPPGIFVLNMTANPMAAVVARRFLAKSDARLWVAVEHRHPRLNRLACSWRRRLRSSRPWLDGHKHALSQPLDRQAFRESAPFLPVVLQTAQAVLDALARRRLDAPHLRELVKAVLTEHNGQSAADLIPLDRLLESLFPPSVGVPARSASRTQLFGGAPEDEGALLSRARRVTQLLDLCPELSSGTLSLALLLLESTDRDVDKLAADINGLGQTHKWEQERRGLVKWGQSWSSTIPLTFHGQTLGPERGVR